MESGKIKKIIFLAVTLAVIANLLWGNNVLAKKLELTDREVGNIKNGLDLIKLMVNLSVSDDKLKSVLNMIVKGGQTGTDITYGLLVLSSFNEMEFIDLVVSQRYKKEATDYFERILDERTNLISYYRGIGYDIPRIVMGKITGPMAALTLNTFDITDKAIQALVEINLLKEIKTYDGLRRYFELRRDDYESHEVAWNEAEEVGGFAMRQTSFLGKNLKNNNNDNLEQQFAALYDKWGPYTDEKGIKKEFKNKVADELKNTITLAVEDYDKKLAEEVEKGARISFWNNIKTALAKLAQKVEIMGGVLKEEFVKINNNIRQLADLGGAQVSQAPQEALTGSDLGLTPTPTEAKGTETNLLSSSLREIASEVEAGEEDLITKEIKELEKKVDSAQTASDDFTAVDVGLLQSAVGVKESAPQWCQKQAGNQPLRNSLVFQEIAWMGTQNSANDEWLKLKNISSGEVDLTGWQILDKDQQIKIILDRGRASINGIQAGGGLVLERTDDNSLAGEKADWIYTGALNDNDEALYLFDKNCQLQDEVLASPDWPGGDKNNHWPLARKTDLNWQNQGGQAVIFNYGTPTTPPPEPTITRILISEVRISPIGERFVELYSPNNQNINLTGWYIQRKTQTGSSFNSFITSTNFEGKTIGALGYFLIGSSTLADIFSSLTLTEGNSLRLKNPDQEIIDEVSWENPESGRSWGRQWSTTTQGYNNFELQAPTPRAQNQSPSQSSNLAPSAFFVFTPSNPFTAGQQVVFDAASSSDSDGIIAVYNWDFGDSFLATTGQATTSHSFSSAGNFLISLTVSDNNNATSSAATITVSVAAETPSLLVVFNEIAWAGTKANSADEWIELYNNSSSSVDMAGWRLAAADGYPDITFSTSSGTTTIPAAGYFLLERTNSSTTNVREDYIFTGALNNEGEKLELRDAGNNLIDSINFHGGWSSGSASPNYISMERVSPAGATWASNNLATRNGKDAANKEIGGTPRAKNSVSYSSTTLSRYIFNEFPEVTLTALGSPYISESNWIPANSTLILKEGTILKLKRQTDGNYTATWDIYGRLVAQGTQANPVVITYLGDDEYGGDTNNDSTSTLPVAGSWRYLRFASTTATSTLEGTIVRYGGGNCDVGWCWGAIRQEKGVGLEIKNSTIEKNIWGIFSDESNCQDTFQRIKLGNTTFSQNTINIYQGSGNQCQP